MAIYCLDTSSRALEEQLVSRFKSTLTIMSCKSNLNLVIVGGVAGGMSAATRARRLSETASITVFEMGPYVGYANCGIPYALGQVIQNEEALVLNTAKSFKDRFNLDVHLGSEVVKVDRERRTVEVSSGGGDIRQFPYDKLILAQGAKSFVPPIKGIDLPHVSTLQTIPDLQKVRAALQKPNAKHAAIIGGGFIGLEAADNLRALGLEVSIIEMAPQVFLPVDRDMAEHIHTELRQKGVRLYLEAKITEIVAAKGDQAACVLLQDGEAVPADVVIAAVGVRPRVSLAQQAGLEIGKSGFLRVNEFMQTSDPDIYAVGDMVETEHRLVGHPLPLALAGPAARQGRVAVDHIFTGIESGYRGNVGTSACKVFDLTVASAGLSLQSLRQMKREPLYVTVHPPSHAGYYPGSQRLTVRVIFEQGTGQLLGAQVVGKDMVDKQIDVLSTAIQANMTVFDLEHLELAYAPPYGSAKSPVNMAGFVASNLLRGQTKITHPEDLFSCNGLESSVQLVDVRSPAEYNRGHIPFALNLPLNDLRKDMKKLDKNRPVIVYCAVGYRGYLAYRILCQHGFKVTNLDGGYELFIGGGFGHRMN